MTLGRNLLAGLANSIWSALVAFAVVPFYLKYLGMEAYGLVGFFMTAQVMFQLLDMGLAPTMNREVARYKAAGDMQAAGKLLHTLAVIYWSMAIAIAGLAMVVAPFVASYWLKSQSLPRETVVHAVMLMGLVVASRWPIGLYQAALIGAQRMTVSSAVNMTMVTLAAVGAVSVLALVSPTIEAFFIWQACVGVAYALILRRVTWQVIGPSASKRFDSQELKRIWRFTAGMSAIGLTGLLFSQLDKLMLSKILTLEDFGHYTLATVVVSALYILITPTFNLIYPRFSSFVAQNDGATLSRQYQMGSRLLASVLFPAATFLAVFAKDLVYLWTGNSEVATEAAPIIALLAAGSALHGVMHFPYALQLAHGATRLSLTIYLVLIVAMLPLFVLLPMTFGTVGGGVAWLAAMVFYTLFGTWYMHRHILRKIGLRWLVRDVGTPLFLSMGAGLAIHHLLMPLDGQYIKSAGAALMIALLPPISILLSTDLRGQAWGLIKHRFP